MRRTHTTRPLPSPDEARRSTLGLWNIGSWVDDLFDLIWPPLYVTDFRTTSASGPTVRITR